MNGSRIVTPPRVVLRASDQMLSWQDHDAGGLTLAQPARFYRARVRVLNVARDFVADAADFIFRRRDPMVPPRFLRLVGRGDYRAIGTEFLAHAVDLAKLQPDDSVLD